MADNIKMVDPPEWLEQLNLDIHYRAVAGLGKRTVQIHQEEFVNRAWKQVEAVNALNYELYQRLLSVNTNDALKDKVLDPSDTSNPQYNAQYIARMMRYLGSMKNAQLNGGLSLSNILANSKIPAAFASASFQHLADDIAKRAAGLNTATLMENIAKNQIFSNMPDLDHSLTNIKQLYKSKHPHKFVVTVMSDASMKNLIPKVIEKFSSYFNIELNLQAADFSTLFNFKPKRVNHTQENSANHIFAPNYKLKRYNDFFKELLNPWTLNWSFFHTNNRNTSRLTRGDEDHRGSFDKGVNHTNRETYCTNFLNSDEIRKPIYYNISLRMREFLVSGKTKHVCSYGYTSDRVGYTPREVTLETYRRSYYAKEYGEPNVIVLDDSEFKRIFSLDNCIIRMGGNDGYYFVPKKFLKSYRYTRGAIRQFVHLPDSYSDENINSFDNCIEAEIVYNYGSYQGSPKYRPKAGSYNGVPVLVDPAPEISNKLFTGGDGKYWYHPSQLYYPLLWRIFDLWRDGRQTAYRDNKDAFCNTLVNRIRPTMGISPIFRSEDSYKTMVNYQGLTREISEYLFENPDHIELDIEKFKNQGGKVINTYGYNLIYNFFKESAMNDPNEQTKYSLFKPWKEFSTTLKSLNKEINKIGANQKKQQDSISAIDPDTVKAWQESADHSEAYERMKDVAETYYAEFFGLDENNTEFRKKLRDKYIDELLLSRYPILAYPIFPEPVYYYLRMFSEKFIMPNVDNMPDDSVAMFLSNEAFTEAYLCGMNTEMGRELLWREYPTDQRGSYFRKFWDNETTVEDIHNDNFFDVKPLHTWSGKLGSHLAESKTGLILFVIRASLMRQYPSTQVFLHKAKGTYNGTNQTGTIAFDTSAAEEGENPRIIKPMIQAYIREDILLVGFKKDFDKAVGNPKEGDFGYFLTFQEDVQDLNFAYNDTSEAENAAAVADKLKNYPTLYGKHLSLFI